MRAIIIFEILIILRKPSECQTLFNNYFLNINYFELCNNIPSYLYFTDHRTTTPHRVSVSQDQIIHFNIKGTDL